jgi:predicted amidohydrolase
VAFNLERHAFWLERALKERARFIGFPEFSLTGWVNERAQALALDARPLSVIEGWARKHRVFIATCLVEKRGRKLHNTAVLVGPRGRLGAMRKINLIRAESAHYAPGRAFPVFAVAGCQMGVATCADATRYEMIHILSLRGAEVIFAPHANSLGAYGNHAAGWLKWRRERWPLFARDACVYIVGCNNAGRFETRQPGEEPTKYCGGGAILDFKGEVVAKAPVGKTKKECMIVADLDLDALRAARRQSKPLAEFRAAIVYNRRSGWVHGRP